MKENVSFLKRFYFQFCFLLFYFYFPFSLVVVVVAVCLRFLVLKRKSIYSIKVFRCTLGTCKSHKFGFSVGCNRTTYNKQSISTITFYNFASGEQESVHLPNMIFLRV